MTETRPAQETLGRAALLQEARAHLLAVAETGTLDEFLTAAVDAAEELTGSTIGFFHFVSDSQQELLLQAWSTHTVAHMCTAEGKGQHYPVAAAGIWADAVRHARPVVHNDYAGEPGRRGLPKGHAPVQRELVVPVMRDGLVVAVMGVGNKPDPYNDDDVISVELLSYLVCDHALHKQTQQQLRGEKQLSEALLATMPDLVTVIDVETLKVVRWSRAVTELTGYTDEEVARLPVPEGWFDGPAAETVSIAMGRLAAGETDVVETVPLRRKDGTSLRVEYRGSMLKDAQGTPYAIAAFGRDVTQRERAEAEARAVFAHVSDGIFVADSTTGRLVNANPAMCRLLGVTPPDLIGRSVEDVAGPGLAAVFFVERPSASAAAPPRTVELWLESATGQRVPVELSLSMLPVGNTWWTLGLARDLTERRRVEQRERESAAQLKNILETFPKGVVIIGRDKQIRWANQAARELTLDSLVGKPCHQYLCGSKNGVCPLLDQGRPMEKVESQLACGTRAAVLTTLRPVVFEGEPAVMEAFLDMRAHRQLELELGHARKLEAVGNLAAGIAHEINTPIQYVGDSLQFLKEVCESYGRLVKAWRGAADELKALPEAQAVLARFKALEEEEDLDFLIASVPGALARSFDGVSRVSTIVRGMKEFAHPDTRDKQPADLNKALESTVTIARSEYKYVADLRCEFGELPPVLCHLGDLNQVFLNLIVNAAHAIAEAGSAGGPRGRIVVRTRQEGDWARIDISDSGTGIPEHLKGRIFEPFFTTKPVGKGTGQGLAIARSIVVDKHHGSLTFETTPGVGTTFTVRLPIDGARRGQP